jgi:hypothetical protein
MNFACVHNQAFLRRAIVIPFAIATLCHHRFLRLPRLPRVKALLPAANCCAPAWRAA